MGRVGKRKNENKKYIITAFMTLVFFMLINTSADAKTYGFDDYKIKDGFKYTISLDECLIFSYIGTKKDEE